MSSRDLSASYEDGSEPASAEVHFALVITRMLETVQNHPEHMRQVVYDLARYKLEEQFTHSNAQDVPRAKQALETAIRGVEEFSRQQVSDPLPSAPPLPISGFAAARQSPVQKLPPAPTRTVVELARGRFGASWSFRSIATVISLFLLLAGAAVLAMERQRLASLGKNLVRAERPAVAASPAPLALTTAQPSPTAAQPTPLRPTSYGVYAVIGDRSLAELTQLPGRPPDIRVAISAAFKVPDQAGLPNDQPKFIVFRRDSLNNGLERAEVRVVAKVAREFSAEATGKKLGDGDDAWVIRNFSYPFRVSPLPDRPEMYELHSEDTALELPPGRYALILKNQAYYFRIDGDIVDPRQCIERVVATNGTFYSACKKP
ncbi:hypothetical protein [Bradyrhizobium liaoningense]|uniref:hypothetical protein n=1 Tax=Bradyrhizobium liaoningense TaxID=43992 RepID=UPI001BA57362|nr:hypothetical protein [Bradyrhizobium liaoningense]MBR1172295.1 hypothetical protein [Bradyrhizobium liaoningense]